MYAVYAHYTSEYDEFLVSQNYLFLINWLNLDFHRKHHTHSPTQESNTRYEYFIFNSLTSTQTTAEFRRRGYRWPFFSLKNTSYLPFLLRFSCLTVLHPVVISGSNILEWKYKLGCWMAEYSKDFPKITSALDGLVIT